MSEILFYSSGVVISFEQHRESQPPDHLTPYEIFAWQFCHDWLAGKETFVLHTSGSTGVPKPIALHRRQMAASAALTCKTLGLIAGDTALVNLHVQYIAGVMMLVRGMECGLRLTVAEPSSHPLTSMDTHSRFDFQSYVPLQLQSILDGDPEKVTLLNTAKAILVGGATVSEALEEKSQMVRAPIFQTYGMTETVSHVALRCLNGPNRQGFYSALDTISFQTDTRNCLVIQAPMLTEGPVITNDVVELLSPTTFRWLGRADHVINSGGVKVQAETVEREVGAVLAERTLSLRFFVAGVPDAHLGEAVCLFLESPPLSAELENNILQNLKTRLHKYQVPRRLIYVAVFAETATAKIDRKRILASALTAKNTPT